MQTVVYGGAPILSKQLVQGFTFMRRYLRCGIPQPTSDSPQTVEDEVDSFPNLILQRIQPHTLNFTVFNG
jgi:hypothetical protein